MSSESEDANSSGDEDYVPPAGDRSDDDESKTLKHDSGGQSPEKNEPSKEEVDKVWSEFKTDVNDPKKSSDPPQTSNGPAHCSKELDAAKGGVLKIEEEKKTITVTKVYDFAGEDVKVTKELALDSKEAKSHLNSLAPKPGAKRPGGGLQKLLGKMGKKPKMSTLEKSRLDWQNYKEQEGIQDELKNFNKGKEGYLEKRSFLERTDHRQFEKEREMRLAKIGKR